MFRCLFRRRASALHSALVDDLATHPHSRIGAQFRLVEAITATTFGPCNLHPNSAELDAYRKKGCLMEKEKLVFVYNADGGVLNSIMDSAHKLFAPSTYQCALCAVTHGIAGMRSEWKDYMRGLSYETRFYHRDGFQRDWSGIGEALPAIFFQATANDLKILISRSELESVTSVAQLTALLGRRIAEMKLTNRNKEVEGR